ASRMSTPTLMPAGIPASRRAAAASNRPLRGGVRLPIVLLASAVLGTGCVAVPRPSDAPQEAALSCRQVVPSSAPPVTWWSVPTDRDRAHMLRWCETVGPVVFQPAPRAPATAPT